MLHCQLKRTAIDIIVTRLHNVSRAISWSNVAGPNENHIHNSPYTPRPPKLVSLLTAEPKRREKDILPQISANVSTTASAVVFFRKHHYWITEHLNVLLQLQIKTKLD